jgi:hypothetical protein
MNAPLENRDLMAGIEELERRSLHIGVTTQSEDDPDDPIAKFARLLAQREGSCESVVEPPGPLPLSAGRKGDDSWDRDSLDKFEALLRTDSAAIETEVKDARPRTTGGASSKAATSNALPDSTGELKPPRHRVKAARSGLVGIADKGAALRRSLHVRVGVVLVGLAGLGAGMAFWHNASSPLGASAIKTQTEPAERLSQGVTGVDAPAQDSAIVDPPLAAPVERHEQPFAASRPKTPSAIDPRDEGELTNQSASAPIPPAPTQTQAEPVGMAASPMTEKAETLSAAPFIVGIRPSAAPPPAAATLSPPQGAATLAPPPRPKTGAQAPNTAKPTVAAKLNNRSHPEQIVKPAKTIAPETVAKPGPTQPPIGKTEAPAPKPAARPEADDPFAFFTHFQ